MMYTNCESRSRSKALRPIWQVTHLLSAVWMVMTLSRKEPWLGCVDMLLREAQTAELIVAGGDRALYASQNSLTPSYK
jgi:hypothetical protein